MLAATDLELEFSGKGFGGDNALRNLDLRKVSLEKWKEVRRQRIVGKNAISVTLKDMKVSISGNEATARFRQNYAAGALKSTTMKTLRLQREGAQWRITHEGTGA